jgi:hypothetical protein
MFTDVSGQPICHIFKDKVVPKVGKKTNTICCVKTQRTKMSCTPRRKPETSQESIPFSLLLGYEFVLLDPVVCCCCFVQEVEMEIDRK